jgi:hypothetical protein
MSCKRSSAPTLDRRMGNGAGGVKRHFICVRVQTRSHFFACLELAVEEVAAETSGQTEKSNKLVEMF